jgi:hypothetical protein
MLTRLTTTLLAFSEAFALAVSTAGASGVSAFGGGWGRRIWRVGCEFRAGLAGSLWRRTAARIPKGAGQNGSVFRLRLGVGIGRLPGNGTRRRSRLGVTRWRRVGGQTRSRRGTEGVRVGGDSVRSRSVSGRVDCVRMAQGRGCKTEAQRVKMASALAALVARRGNKRGRNSSGFRPLVVGLARLAARRESRRGRSAGLPPPAVLLGIIQPVADHLQLEEEVLL